MKPAHTTGLNPQILLKRFKAVRSYTKGLCEPLELEDYIPQPIEDVSPAKWNIAHTTWFFEEMILKPFADDYKEFDPDFCYLFNSYYNTVGERTLRHKRGDLSRPTVQKVFEYRAYVEDALEALLTKNATPEILVLVELGINHEQQHQELFLTDLKYVLSLNQGNVVYKKDFNLANKSVDSKEGYTKTEEGFSEIGHNSRDFCFDNELPRHKRWLGECEISNRLVTNAEYFEFIESGAYSDHRLWHAEGWDWVNSNGIDSPLYWETSKDGWQTFTLAGRQPVLPDAPVTHVSFYEASAFAEFSGRRLPTEFEWETASNSISHGIRWEWTSSSYEPYPGFETSSGAVGEYNGKFMVNQKVLRGGSTATPSSHSRNTYRNFFHPHLRWQFTGIRLAKK